MNYTQSNTMRLLVYEHFLARSLLNLFRFNTEILTTFLNCEWISSVYECQWKAVYSKDRFLSVVTYTDVEIEDA